jgi:hypothetical protein
MTDEEKKAAAAEIARRLMGEDTDEDEAPAG